MAITLSNLVNNLGERIRKIKCKDCNCSVEYKSLKNDSMKYICFLAIKIIETRLIKNLKKGFGNTFKFSKNGINEFT